MDKALEIRRNARRVERVQEFVLAPLPTPSEQMLKLPGVREWWNQMVLTRERDVQSINRLITSLTATSVK